jgi:hypothetical protein
MFDSSLPSTHPDSKINVKLMDLNLNWTEYGNQARFMSRKTNVLVWVSLMILIVGIIVIRNFNHLRNASASNPLINKLRQNQTNSN